MILPAERVFNDMKRTIQTISLTHHILPATLCIMMAITSAYGSNLVQGSNYVQPKQTSSVQGLSSGGLADQRYLTVSAVMLLIICVLIYKGYTGKKRSRAIIAKGRAKIHSQNEMLLKLLTEKEWLIREIHHRVKNNLQIVISLLNTQSAYLHNQDALDAIKNSQHRMQTMSLIHQKLYQSDNLSTIEMSVYIRELVEYLSESVGQSGSVKISFDVSPVRLDVSQAIPLGLIINEAISNSIKYAFKEQASGQINVLLRREHDDTYLMCISDNGIGLADNFDPYNTSSLGMSLMQGLAQQMDGEFMLSNKGGLRICVSFEVLKFNNLEMKIA